VTTPEEYPPFPEETPLPFISIDCLFTAIFSFKVLLFSFFEILLSFGVLRHNRYRLKY
jgi:hypothetical protein